MNPPTPTRYNKDGKPVKTTALNENRDGSSANRVTSDLLIPPTPF